MRDGGLGLRKLERKMKKIAIKIMVLIIILSYLFVCLGNVSLASTKKAYASSDLASYPGFSDKINALKAAHPNWNFTILYTGLDWSDVLENETYNWHGRSLVPTDKTGDWICPFCQYDTYDTGWYCASEAAVAYYMDPRNFLNEDNVFMFEDLGYNAAGQTIDGVKKIIGNAPYLNGSNITYRKTDGTTGTINQTYAEVIMEAAQKAGISPYHLASRILQEQGNKRETASSTGCGTYAGYEGYYNFLNINASGNGTEEVIRNGLEHAKAKGWTDPKISIEKGAEFLARSYIGVGQCSLYLQKFDVDDSDGKLYYHQYQQNIMAPIEESKSIKNTYKSLGVFDANSNFKINFIIPVYRNMPNTQAGLPSSTSTNTQMDTIVTEDVKLTGDGVAVRSERGTSGKQIAKLYKGDIVLRIRKGHQEINGYEWDCIVLSNGTKGYISSKYLEKITTQSNCNQAGTVVGTGVRVRNGPGTEKTAIVTKVNTGDRITRIETGKYNGLNNENWDRVILADGTVGYMASRYVSVGVSNTNFRADGSNFLCEPDVTENIIRNTHSNATFSSNTIGTGTRITIDSNTYTIIKKGDVNGDGKISSSDLLKVQKHLLKVALLDNTPNGLAADANNDGKISSSDLLKIQKYLLGVSGIEI